MAYQLETLMNQRMLRTRRSKIPQAADARNFLSRWFNSRRKVQDFWLLNQGDKKSAP
jgi:hypothetical protein